MYLSAILFILAVFAFVIAWVLRRDRGGMGNASAVVSAVETFAEQMEAENDRLIGMIAALRQKMDEDALASAQSLASFENQLSRLQQQIAQLERAQESMRTADRSAAEPTLPEFLSPKYQEVAKRLLRGDEVQQIMVDLQLGRGEVDLVARLIESEREER